MTRLFIKNVFGVWVEVLYLGQMKFQFIGTEDTTTYDLECESYKFVGI